MVVITDILIDARKGAGSAPEILYGTVTWKPTLAHARGTSIVLPAPTTYDLIDGKATATNVQPTPEPVEGQIEWAYEVTFKDRHSKTYSFLVGVPDSVTTVNFASLPRYFETRPPAYGVGPAGPSGEAATIAIGAVTSGEEPEISNSGTSRDAVLDFVLPKGDKGDTGEGVPEGGTALQVIRKNAGNTSTEWATLNKASVGLTNVDNTSDADKPVSTLTQIALDSKYPYLKAVPAGSLDLVTSPGKYTQGAGSQVTLENGYPWDGSSGTLDVYPYAATLDVEGRHRYLVQEWFSASDNRKAMRSSATGGSDWRPWVEYSSSTTRNPDLDRLPLITQDLSRFDPVCYWEIRPENSSQWTQGFSVNEDTEEIYVSAHNYNLGIEVPAQWVECRDYNGNLKWRTPDIPVLSTSAYSEGLPYFYNESNELCFILRLNTTGVPGKGIISLYNSVTNTVYSTMEVLGNSKLFADDEYFYTTTSVAAYASLYTVYKYTLSSVKAGVPQLVASYSMQNFGQSINDEKPQGFMVMDGKFVTAGGARATNTPPDNGKPGFRIYDSSGNLTSSTSLDRKDFKRAMAEVFPWELVYPTGINGVNYENEGLYPLRDGRIMVMHNLYTYTFMTIHGSKGEQKVKIRPGNISRASGDWEILPLNEAGGIVPFDSGSIPKFKYDGNFIVIRGAVKGVEAIGGSYILGTLPPAYRITLPNWNHLGASNGSAYWRCRVSNGGNIQIIAYSGTITPETWLPLDMVIPYSVNY